MFSKTADGSNVRAGAMCNVFSFPARSGAGACTTARCPSSSFSPRRLRARTVRFSAGLELNVLNYLLSLCALPCRWFGLDFSAGARLFLNVSLMLFPFGTTNGALAIWVRGRNHSGRSIERRIALVTDYDGPATPSSAAVVMARKILQLGPPPNRRLSVCWATCRSMSCWPTSTLWESGVRGAMNRAGRHRSDPRMKRSDPRGCLRLVLTRPRRACQGSMKVHRRVQNEARSSR